MYQWKRFWCPRDGLISLADDGYLYDPDSEYGSQMNGALVPLTSFAGCPCLVMLGEPGIGKSTEFEELARGVEAEVGNTGDTLIRIDLREYQTDGRLIAEAFDNQVVREWVEGDHNLYLLFDSLDEGHLQISNIAAVISGQIRKLRDHADRLRIRIACRTAEWPTSLESALCGVWDEEQVRIVELAPLRRLDIAEAAQVEKVDSDRFLDCVSQREAQPFAINPITLKFLLGTYRQTGGFPTTKQELFEAGCLKLCTETSLSRHEAGHSGELSASIRLEICSRIAATLVFCGRNAIETGIQPITSTDAVAIADLAGGVEAAGDDLFDVTEAHIRETLSSTLFTGHGAGRLGFAHQTYAEFLAARYVTNRGLDLRQLESLILHDGGGTKVVPQLAETAAWMAVGDQQLFQSLLRSDPQTLLRSDVATADDSVKSRLIEHLVAGLQSEELDDTEWSLRDHYRKLAHPGLAAQLETLIRDQTQNIVTRRFAIDLAEECREPGLLDALVCVALDTTDDSHIRAQAAHAVVAIDDQDAIQQLRPLADGSAGPDSLDELRGCALRGLWRHRLMNAEDLFASLITPQRQSFTGAYRHFITFELKDQLQPNDIPVALRWLSGRPSTRGHIDDFGDLAAEIAQQGLRRLNDGDVQEAFAEFLASRIRLHDSIPFSSSDLDTVSDELRRELTSAVVGLLDNERDAAYGVLYGETRLTSPDDLGWMLEQAANAQAESDQRLWAQLARRRFLHGGGPQIDHVLRCCADHAILDEVFAGLIHPIELDSEEAERLRTEYEQNLELEERMRDRREPPQLDPPPSVLVAQCLERFEAGDINGWWQLNRQMQLKPTSTHYHDELKDDLTELPGWEEADDERRSRILSAARDYLTAWESSPGEWIESRTIHFPDFAGYRALVLIDRLDPEFLDSLADENWANLAPAIIGFPSTSGIGNEQEQRQQRFLERALRHAPQAVIENLLRLIDRENSDEGNQHLYVLNRVDSCEHPDLTTALLDKAQSGTLRPSLLGDLLTDLAGRNCRDALEYARTLVTEREDETSRQCAEEAAQVIWLSADDRGWDTLWPEFQSDRAFFRNVIEAVAHDRRQLRVPPTGLSEERLADLYILLSEEYPHAEDPDIDGAHCVGTRESVQHYRDGVISALRERGTLAACAAIERVRAALPHLDHLGWTLRAARKAALQASWMPLSVEQLRGITARPRTRLVRNGRELQEVILESLDSLVDRLRGENPAVRDIWDLRDKGKWRPVDENDFSNHICRHLDADLRNRGIVALREVEIRRGNGGPGERTDIYVTAVVPGYRGQGFETIRVILEVKGCWHDELQTAMETQLKDRYLKDNDCEHGIYVVGWFACDAWDAADSRKRKTPSCSLEDAQQQFDSQAQTISDEGNAIRASVIDASLK